MKRIKFVGELSNEDLNPIVKELREVHDMNNDDIYNFVNSKLDDVDDALNGTSYKVLRDENNYRVGIVRRSHDEL